MTKASCLAPLALLALSACGADSYPDRWVENLKAGPTEDAGAPEPEADAGQPETWDDDTCQIPETSEHMPARTGVIKAASTAAGVFTRDLFQLVKSNCGACHVEQGQGGFQFKLEDFATKVDAEVIARVTSDDPAEFMPPPAAGGKPYSERGPDDPVVDMTAQLKAWLAAGSPGDVFYPVGAAGGGPAYPVDPEVLLAITNIGTCIPPVLGFASEEQTSVALDEMFAEAQQLPDRLEKTDLVTFDSEVLARYGVISFAPAYTLWADNAKKWRMVRVPRGQKITFDATTQHFDIPENTRFYKTFFKEVTDYRGEKRYKRMETRLIVARRDDENPTGPATNALFGTYVWNDEETEAVLLRDPLRNGKPFRDRTFTYITNEQVADEVTAKGPDNLQEALEEAGVTRTYALPGSERCIHCHMGAPNRSFVLGFTPLQVHRRPLGEGGVIEEAGPDELNQLQRLIDYGVIEGLASVAEVVPLEQSQAPRKPRTPQELTAQGYIYGNCSHCHNPVGYPSVAAPEIKELLNFYPSEQGGGIFEFPLDRFSPRVTRDVNANFKVPYITPSLYDRFILGDLRPWMATYLKTLVATECPPCEGPGDPSYELKTRRPILAPWRSLVYRNVDTPFTYAEDSAIFPHMPMDTPGYDCRARHLLGSWMASIPARFKYAAVGLQDGLQKAPESTMPELAAKLTKAFTDYSNDPQPWEEVKEGEPGYRVAAFDGLSRALSFEKSARITDCREEALDPVDPAVVRGQAPTPTLIDQRQLSVDGTDFVYSLNIPERPHYADTDLTESAGPWGPRRADWYDALTKKPGATLGGLPEVIDILSTVKATDQDALTGWNREQLALQRMPFGLWKIDDKCDYSGQQAVQDYPASERLEWMAGPFVDKAGLVYEVSAGAQVFNSICANCHGPLADSQGRNAAVMAELTGGNTRVANLRDGLFGPPDNPGSNLERVFGGKQGGSAVDWGARYMAWMGLGGTQRLIPATILTLVGNTPILGQRRPIPSYDVDSAKDANMLSVASALCGAVIPEQRLQFDREHGLPIVLNKTPLMYGVGDGAMWERICTFQNPLPIRVIRTAVNEAGDTLTDTVMFGLALRRAYPPSTPVGDPRTGKASSLLDDNPAPWCLERDEAVLKLWPDAPVCPDALLTSADFVTSVSAVSSQWVREWKLRGAVNAGISAFLYLRAVANGDAPRQPLYNQCPISQ